MASKRKIIDGVEVSKFSREQLEQFTHKLKETNDREREERNYFQSERDKFRRFWELSRIELETAKAALQNRDRQLEEADEKNEKELSLYKQKVKYLQYQQQNNLNDSQAETILAFKKVQDQFSIQEKELLQDKRKLRGLLKEQQLSGLEQIKDMKMQNIEEIGKTTVRFEARAKDLEIRYEKKFNDLMQHLTSKYEMEISQVEEQKNAHISELTKHHEQSFNDLRNYYNNVTLNNLTLINTLKAEMEKLKKIDERMTKQVSDLTAELKRIKIPLAKADETIKGLNRQLNNYKRDKTTLANTKMQLEKKNKELEHLRWSYASVGLRFSSLQKERDELHNRFVNAVLEVQEKTCTKNLSLQRNIKNLSQVAERRETVIAELQKTATQPPLRSSQKLEEILAKKNAKIADVQYELARVCKMHDELLETFEHKLVQFGIPKEELGFVPLRIVPEGQGGLSTAPAGLVTKNR